MSGREVAKRAERCPGMSTQGHKTTRFTRLLLGTIIQRRRRQRCMLRCPAAGAISAVDSLNNPTQLLQLVYMLSIVGWVGAIMGLCFLALKFAGIFRVDPALEEEVRGHGCSCTCSATSWAATCAGYLPRALVCSDGHTPGHHAVVQPMHQIASALQAHQAARCPVQAAADPNRASWCSAPVGRRRLPLRRLCLLRPRLRRWHGRSPAWRPQSDPPRRSRQPDSL